MASLTVRVPDRLRREMRKLSDINWSAVVRDAIEDRIRIEELGTKRDWDRVRQAARMTDSIFQEMSRKYGHIQFNSAETIRYWREKRYGPT
jgi:hypothetical protein